MKIALYIDPLTAFEHSFYTKELLVESLRGKSHDMKIFLPIQEYTLSKELSAYSELYPAETRTIFGLLNNLHINVETYKNIIELFQNKANPKLIIVEINKFKDKYEAFNRMKKKYKKNSINPDKLSKEIEKKKKKQIKKLKNTEPFSAEVFPSLDKTESDKEPELNDKKPEPQSEAQSESKEPEPESKEPQPEPQSESKELEQEIENNTEKNDEMNPTMELEQGTEKEIEPEPDVPIKLSKRKKDEMGYIIDLERKYMPTRSIRSQFVNDIDHLAEISFVETTYPVADDYDVLLVTDTYTKGWYWTPDGKVHDFRYKVIADFIKAGKKVLMVRDTALIEYRFIPFFNLNNGVCTSTIFKLPVFNYPNYKHFIMPMISNLKFQKPNMLSKEEFYSKYGLDLKYKILCLIPGKVAKWRKMTNVDNTNQKTVAKNVTVFYDKMDRLNEIANELGYTFVSKLHTRDSYVKWEKSGTLKQNYITYIDPYDTNEMLTYADKAISYGTTMVYQMYLFDLPCLDIGSGKYYFGWSDEGTSLALSPLKNYRYGIDLIYGDVAGKFRKKPSSIFTDFLKKDFDINKFKYKLNNPIYGNSYNSSIKEIRECILRALK